MHSVESWHIQIHKVAPSFIQQQSSSHWTWRFCGTLDDLTICCSHRLVHSSWCHFSLSSVLSQRKLSDWLFLCDTVNAGYLHVPAGVCQGSKRFFSRRKTRDDRQPTKHRTENTNQMQLTNNFYLVTVRTQRWHVHGVQNISVTEQ